MTTSNIIVNGYGDTHKSECTTNQKRQRRENSYSYVVNQHVNSLNVAKEEILRYYSVVHTIMAEAGIIDSAKTADAGVNDKRYKPFDNSPYGAFVGKERVADGERKSVNSYLLNEVGMAKVKEILTKHVTDRYLTKGQIASAQQFRDSIKEQMNVEFLKTYLKYKGIDFDDKQTDRIVFRAPSVENQSTVIPYTCYFNNPTKVQYKSSKRDKDFTSVFYLIHSLEVPVLCNDTQEKAIRAARIFREYWNMQFNGVTEWEVKTDEDDNTTSAPGSETGIQNNLSTTPVNSELQVHLTRIEQILEVMMKHLNLEVPVSTTECTTNSDTKVSTKSAIISTIKELAQPLAEQKRYKTISREQIDKEKKTERKKLLQDAYDYLDNRRLLTAKYKPQDGWKFDCKRKNIELLYRVDSRQSAVYNTRHRPLVPFMKDGKVLKEMANAGEKYPIPYGLEKIDYSFKTIFVTEGIFDSCFLKNCLAYSNWILPTGMNKVVQIFRDNGYQIIHILDNDKGGNRGLETMVRSHDWLQQGDKVFNWLPYSDCKDLNEVAMKYVLDEIDPQTILANTWNEEEVKAHLAAQNEKSEEQPAEPQFATDEDLDDLLQELEQEQSQSHAEQEERKRKEEEVREQEVDDWDAMIEELYNPKPYLYQTPGITIPAPHP